MNDLLPGTEVSARGLRWEVVFVQPAGDQRLYRVRCLESALRGQELDLLVPFEKVEPIATEPDPTRPGRLQEWRLYHDAFLLEQELGPNALLAAQPGRLRIAAYQLVPVMRALAMPRPRLLLADDVGLGKTIEAGLVLAELIARRRAHRVLIVAPAGPLLHQWYREMRERFGLRFEMLDAASLKEIRYANELGANPFDHVALGLISVDFAKQERILEDLERSQYDVVIIDEAHHAVRLGESGDREDSLRRRLAEVLARRADALLLLTATPHDGYDPHFASLIELLDPSLVDGRGALRADAYRKHIVRRLKRHIIDPETGKPMFRERKVLPEPVTFSAAETPAFARMQEGLLALVAPQLRRALKRRHFGEVLAFIALLKRSVSSASACAHTLKTVANRLRRIAEEAPEKEETRKQRIRTLRELHRRRARFGGLSFEEEQDQAELEAEDIAAELAQTGVTELREKLLFAERDHKRERARLKEVVATAEALELLAGIAVEASDADPKVKRVCELVEIIRAAEPRANVLVYSEYADSQRAIVKALVARARAGGLTGEISALSGDDNDKVRVELTDAFRARNDIVLVSTDASAEGLNLHERCHHVIHLELPYNPNRLEQRNGRIDRFGQTHDPIVRYLYLAGTFEERLLLRLVAKHERQKRLLNFVPNTLGLSLTDLGEDERLLAGLSQEDDALFKSPKLTLEQAGEPDDTRTPAYRDLLGELDRVFADFEKTAKAHPWLGNVGMDAGPAKIQEADTARRAGERLGVTDLMSFVKHAVASDSADPHAVRTDPNGVVELALTPAWTFGLDELPGYDAAQKVMRLTQNVDSTHDAEGRPLGFVGRAHPIVRRALDRVRNIRLGKGDHLSDRRVAVTVGDAPEPEVIVTYLARLQSGEGRELERVIAVRHRAGVAPTALSDASDWLALTSADRARSSRDVWKTHFASWVKLHDVEVRSAADRAFHGLAATFTPQHLERLDEERRELEIWIKSRAEALCGPPDLQGALFDSALPAWRSARAPAERLASFANERTHSPRNRSEAQTAVALYNRRAELIHRRSKLEPPSLSLLGLLLLVPNSASAHEAG